MIRYSPFPRALEIQTVSYCNAHCSICPYAEASKELPVGVMDMTLFRSIIDQVPIPWGMRIIPYFNSEPFLDPQLFDRLRYINERLPDAEIELSTNVSRLDASMQQRMVGITLKELRLSVFGFTEPTHKHAMPYLRWPVIRENLELLAKNKGLRSSIGQVSLVMVDYPDLQPEDIVLARNFCYENFIKFENWGFMDRSQNVVKYSNNVYHAKICGCSQNRPLDCMHIGHTGAVVLCCMDWRWTHTLGDVSRQTLQEVWDSLPYQLLRQRIYGGGDDVPEICKKCILAIG